MSEKEIYDAVLYAAKFDGLEPFYTKGHKGTPQERYATGNPYEEGWNAYVWSNWEQVNLPKTCDKWQEGWDAAHAKALRIAAPALKWIEPLSPECKEYVASRLGGGIWLNSDEEKQTCSPCLNCNDLFFWGCADAEDITHEGIPALIALEEEFGPWNVDVFIARKRGLRPQGAAYPCPDKIEDEEKKAFAVKAIHALNEAGPERETGLGNPRPVPVLEEAKA